MQNTTRIPPSATTTAPGLNNPPTTPASAVLRGHVNCAINRRTAKTRPYSSRGVCVCQIVVAKNASALPKTETDCVAQTTKKVRKPCGGGWYDTR